ncbi:MAG: hypothetical protein WBN75_12845 [Verrucomicrobiia bacterium]
MPDEPPATGAKVEKLAQSSFVLGIASILCGITALPAIIQSIRTLVLIRKHSASKAALGKAIFGLVFPSGILAFLIFTAVSMLQAARAEANDIYCIDNLKQLAVDLKIYQMDHNDTFPPANRWCDAIQSTNLACPFAPRKQRCSYAMNARLGGIKDRGQIPNDTILLFESDAGWNAAGGSEMTVLRHPYRLNVAYADGSVMSVNFKDIGKLRWDPSTNSPAESAR